MFPIFKIGTFEMHTFGVMMVIAFFSAIAIATRRAPKFGLKAELIQDVSVWVIFAGIIGARLAYILLHLDYFLSDTKRLMTLQFEGLTSFGGFILGGLFIWILSKKKQFSLLSFFDTVSVPVLVASAIGRIGCLLNGCCHGFACPSPPGVTQGLLPGTYHPAQIYDGLMVMLGVMVLLHLEKQPRRPGFSIGSAFVIYGVARFIYEFWRIGASSDHLGSTPFSLAQVFSVGTILLGIVFMNLGKVRYPLHSKSGPV